MNTDIVKGNWTEMKGKIKTKWGKLTDNDLESLQGNLDQLAGKIQTAYGYAVERAQQEYQDFKTAMASEDGGKSNPSTKQ